MGKRIAFCADGTWDSPAVSDPSNVYRLYKSLASGADQFPLYDDGVGADGTPLDRVAGGALGLGLFQKVKDGYAQIAHLYERGDELFIFGFSRGAYTARSLAGMIAVCGLPQVSLDPTDTTFVDTAFEAYRNPLLRQLLLDSLAHYQLFDAKITMLGVWDTVGSLGIPAIFGGVDPVLCGFLDTSLHPDVLNAFHALSVDERRVEFPATLWTSRPAPGQILEQVWFAGVHCDVGGGYPRPGLADIPLQWMLAKAKKLGLRCADSAPQIMVGPQFALDAAHESWNLFWGFPRHREIPADACLSDSLAIRLQYLPSYRPANLKLDGNGDPASGYSLVDVVGPLAQAAGR